VMRLEARLKRRLLEFALLHLFEMVTLPTKVASRLSEALTHFFKPRPRLDPRNRISDGEVRNPSVIFFFSFLFLLLDHLSRVFDGSTYPFICRSGSWKAISFRSGSTLFYILRSKAKRHVVETTQYEEFSRDNMRYTGTDLGRDFVMLCGECRLVRLILVGFCERRHGILKTHCFGLVAGDKCHDIPNHFSYAGSGCNISPVGRTSQRSLCNSKLLKKCALREDMCRIRHHLVNILKTRHK
ncbi:hypothetical protein IGI04_014017, partial [Brassica rapa subsp. trilocularis]